MNKTKNSIIRSYILEYLKKKSPDLKIKSQSKLFNCPFRDNHVEKSWDEPSCNIFPPNTWKLYCHDPNCKNLGDIFEIVRRLEPDMADLSNEDIADYLINYLNIETDEEATKLLQFYEENNWCLIPLKTNSKIAIEKDWQNTEYRDIRQWQDWLKSNNGLAFIQGEKSQAMTLDIDSMKTYEKIKDKLGNTLHQKTKRGFGHLVYQYDSDFDHINHANLRDKGYDMELRANNAYIVIAPTSVDGEKREWNYESIKEMPKELKTFLLDLIDKKPEEKNNDIQTAIDKEDFGEGLKGLDGCCNQTFVKFGGVLRKKLSQEQTEYVMYNFNKLLESPMPNKDMRSMLQQINRYRTFDKKEIADKILHHLDRAKQASARDLQAILGYDLNDIHEALHYLLREERITQIRSVYHKLEEVNWKENFVKESKLLNFKVPYFNDYAVFRNGDMIVIGGLTGTGKSHLAVNIIKKLVDQGIKPYYISTEPGNRFSSIGMTLGLKEGDFAWYNHYNPEKVELKDNAITIIDWVLPDNYAETDKLYKRFAQQMDKHGGFLIVFAQLKDEDHFYADQMVHFFASLVAKYKYQKDEKGFTDNENTYFETSKIRESKVHKQYVTIPTRYDRETKTLELR